LRLARYESYRAPRGGLDMHGLPDVSLCGDLVKNTVGPSAHGALTTAFPREISDPLRGAKDRTNRHAFLASKRAVAPNFVIFTCKPRNLSALQAFIR
jgi:hypothetical protein